MSRIVGLDKIVHENDTILILGSMPSVESLKQQMYYANKTNRFWKVLSAIYQRSVETTQDKLDLLEKEHIALWDICHSCQRQGSADATIQDIEANPIDGFLKEHPSIQTILCNGKTSYQTLCKFFPQFKEQAIVCPSTSAANATFRLQDLIDIYKERIKK